MVDPEGTETSKFEGFSVDGVDGAEQRCKEVTANQGKGPEGV